MADAPKDRDVIQTAAQVDNPSYQDNLKVRRDPDGSMWIVDAQGNKVMSGVPAAQRALGATSSAQGVELLGDGLDWMRYGYDVVVVLLGQSLGDGRGALLVDEPVVPGALLYRKDEVVVPLREPAGYTGYPSSKWVNNAPTRFDATGRDLLATAARHSAATAFGREFLRLTGMRPLIVPCAIGSTSFTDWLPPVVEDDPTTLFGAATGRAKKALRPGVPLVLWLVGHESSASTTAWDLATGTPTNVYTPAFREYIKNWRERFPDAWMLYGQLSTHSNAVTALAQCVAGDEQRRMETAFNTISATGVYSSDRVVDIASVVTSGTNATNTATLTGSSMRIVSDLGSAVGFLLDVVKPGCVYQLTVVATGTGAWKFMCNGQKGGSYGAGTTTITFTVDVTDPSVTPTTRLQIFRNAACDLTFDLSQMTIKEDIANQTFYKKVMFVEHDAPRNIGADGIHLATAGSDLIGLRAARAAAQQIFGIDINGTGPRLVSITKPAANQVKVKFSREIKEDLNGYGVNLATSLFQVYHNNGVEIGLSACVRDPADATAVLITTSANYTGTVVVVYGARPGPSDTSMRPGCVYDIDGMPAPMFMQVAA